MIDIVCFGLETCKDLLPCGKNYRNYYYNMSGIIPNKAYLSDSNRMTAVSRRMFGSVYSNDGIGDERQLPHDQAGENGENTPVRRSRVVCKQAAVVVPRSVSIVVPEMV